MKPVIVSIASLGRENYNEAQLNMIKSCVRAGWDGDYMLRSVDGYCDNYMGVPIRLGSWPYTKLKGVSWQHKDMPYQFKPYAIQEAREAGYTKILWMDSTCRMLLNPYRLWNFAESYGVVAWDNLGHPVANYISDTALKNFRLTPESVQGIKQIMACCIMFDFEKPLTEQIFDRWLESSIDNSFYPDETNRPGFIAPRHDQAALSIILNIFKVPLLKYGQGFCYHPHEMSLEYGYDICLYNKGVKD